MIITYTHGIFKLPHKVCDDLRLRILGNQEIAGKSQNFIELKHSAQSLSQNENFVNTSKKLLKIETEIDPIVPYFT